MTGVGRVTVSLRRSTSISGHRTDHVGTGGGGLTYARPPMSAPHQPVPAVTHEVLADLAERLATEAGRRLERAVTAERTLVETKTTGTDMVTETDRATEAFLVDGLLAARPDDTVLGEEGADRSGTSGVTWVIDPIDGTTNFVYGIPGFNVSVAAEIDGTVVAGVVVDPLHGEVFRAVLGGGATRNGVAIRVNALTDLAMALVATGFGYDPDRRRRQAEVLTSVLPVVRDIRRLGAAATDLCWVACGRVDAYFEKGLQAWDYAAGGLVAAEAGAVVSDLDGGPTSSAFTLAAPPGIVDALRTVLREADAADV